MGFYDVFVAQLTNPFRIGLLIALLFTARNTLAHTGTMIPLLAGVVFVAVLIPLTFSPEAGNWWVLVGIGLISNAVILAIASAAYFAGRRLFASSRSGN